jgi:hypothetical protein
MPSGSNPRLTCPANRYFGQQWRRSDGPSRERAGGFGRAWLTPAGSHVCRKGAHLGSIEQPEISQPLLSVLVKQRKIASD